MHGCTRADTLALPFAGFAEGAQAGYEFGLVKSTLQVLAAHLAESDSRRAKVLRQGFLVASVQETSMQAF
jgi:hypothetical protein